LPVTFTPSWEVDRFFWPEVAIHIEKAHGDAFQQIGQHLRIANQEGLRVMAITSGERGVGRSTVAMHLARSAAAAGLNVALVDTDTFYPSLVDQLRLDVEHGWQDCLFENVPLEETAVKSIDDGITVFPLTSTISSQQMHANLHRMSKIVKRIASAFDLVLLDSSRLNLEQRDLVGVSQETIVDAAIVVVDTELSIKEKVDTAVSILQGMGIASIGMVENFNG
jgi:Mrp family chromosome partitioning ATPase